MPKQQGTCPVCQKQFEFYPSQSRVFCSNKCAASVNVRLRRERGEHVGRGRRGIEQECKNCGKAIYVKGWQEQRFNHHFCSIDCYNKWQAREQETRLCEFCGKEFSGSKSAILKRGRRFCSKACATEGSRTNTIERFVNGRKARKDVHGYIWVWSPETENSYDGWMLEHRLIVQERLGRVLDTDETVHHINGQKDDNRPENLMLISRREHTVITNIEIQAKRAKEQETLKEQLAELEEYKRRFGPLET